MAAPMKTCKHFIETFFKLNLSKSVNVQFIRKYKTGGKRNLKVKADVSEVSVFFHIMRFIRMTF